MRLSKLIESLGTQVEAARQIGVSQPTVSAWSRGLTLPRGLAIAALANATGRSVADIQALVLEAKQAQRAAPASTPVGPGAGAESGTNAPALPAGA